MIYNKVFWATGIHLLIPSVLRPKRKNFVLHLIIKATWETIIEEKDKKMYAKGTLHSHSATAPFGSPSTVYAVRSVALRSPIFCSATLRKTSHILKRSAKSLRVFAKCARASSGPASRFATSPNTEYLPLR